MSGVTGKYRLDARLGGGGMAEVFVGSSMGAEGFTRRVAIKRVLPGFSDNEAFARMFVAEAQISSRLVHPNIVSVLDFDRDPEQRLFLVMEMVEGKDLDALTATGLLPVPVVIYVVSEVLRGLGYAHDLPVGADLRGVIHRDVSPHNVLLSWEGSIKVSDFGIAKARAASEATASVFIKGKPAYMSPEQANGLALDGRSDLFAVGIMLWELLVGHRLFVGADTRSTLAAVLFGQIPRPRSQQPDVPKDVERVCMKLLERDLGARYATAEEAVADLLACDAAPRDGRAQLSAMLAERYPHDAPVRQSLIRQRAAATSQPPPYASQPPHVVHGGAPQIGAALPSLGGAMVASTGTLPQDTMQQPTQPMGPPAAGGRRLAIVLAITALSGAATFGIVAAVRARGPETPSAPPPPPPPRPGPAVAMTVPDAGIDAAPADAAPPPPPDAKKEETAPQPVHVQAPGALHVTGFPVVTVFVDGKPAGDTPVKALKLSAGKHTLFATNPDNHYSRTLPITIEPGKTLDIDLGSTAP